MFPIFFRAGGWIALAGTHYNFVKEIPMLAKYEVYSGIAAWDKKWVSSSNAASATHFR